MDDLQVVIQLGPGGVLLLVVIVVMVAISYWVYRDTGK